MSGKYRVLTEQQIEHFLARGHVILRNCFRLSLAEEWRALAFRRLGCDPEDPTTWQEARVHLPSMNRVAIRGVAPKVFDAFCDLLGGEDRLVTTTPSWGDGFIINFNIGADRPWQPPSVEAGGWHKDGDFFRHFLDSPEQGLLTIVLWSDILPQSGGTFVACDSVPHVARYLAEHPEGVLPGSFGKLASKCSDFIEITGNTGDVVLIHPYVLHASSQNPSGRVRFITNPPVSLKEPMNFNRADSEDFSPVEHAVLRGLGVEKLDFQIASPRERIVPERVKRQQKMLEEQKKRLAAT